MQIQEIQQILQNKINNLIELRTSMTIAGNISEVVRIDMEIEETKNALSQINGTKIVPIVDNPIAKTYNYTDLDKSCEYFRAVCMQIQNVLPVEFPLRQVPDGSYKFTGGYDEIKNAFQYFNSDLIPLAFALNIANDDCNHEAGKVEMDSPKWWYRCWGFPC